MALALPVHSGLGTEARPPPLLSSGPASALSPPGAGFSDSLLCCCLRASADGEAPSSFNQVSPPLLSPTRGLTHDPAGKRLRCCWHQALGRFREVGGFPSDGALVALEYGWRDGSMSSRQGPLVHCCPLACRAPGWIETSEAGLSNLQMTQSH